MERPDFGWYYPPGVTQRDIDALVEEEHWEEDEDPGEPWMEEDL